MATKIVTKNSSTASAVPTASDLVQGELAVNVADKRLFTEDNAGAIVELGTNPTTLNVNGTATMDGLVVANSTTNAYKAAIVESAHPTTDAGLLFIGGGDYEFGLQQPYNAAGLFFYDRTNNVERMRIDASGRVGIGTSSPASLLHLAATAPVLSFTDTNSFTDANDRFIVRASSDKGNIQWYDDSTSTTSELMTFLPSGNVGIGTSSPSSDISSSSTVLEIADSNVASLALNNTTQSTKFEIASLDVSGGALSIRDNNTERMRIDSAGNVGIGTSSPNIASFGKALTITDPASTNQIPAIELAFGSNTRGANIAVDNRASVKALAITAVASDLAMTFGTNNTERMRIDASGNLLVGTTDANPYNNSSGSTADNGFAFGSGALQIARYNDAPLLLNRTGTNDGDIQTFWKSGVKVGSIAASGGDILIGTGDTAVRFVDAEDSIVPFNTNGSGRDNFINLGKPLERFKNLYLSGGVVFGTTGGSVSSKTLDDYEEGDFTLVLSGATTAGTNSGGSIGGRYTKIGRLVTCNIVIANTTLSGAAGNLRLTGFPFVPANYGNRSPVGVLRTYQQDLASPADGYFSPVITIDHGTNSAVIVQTKDNGTWSVVQVENSSGLYFEGTITYPTA